MRDLDDVRGAFAVLEDRADDYLTRANPSWGGRDRSSTERPVGPIHGQTDCGDKYGHGRQLRLIALVAAVVVATSGVLAVIRDRPVTTAHVSSPAGETSGPPLAPAYPTMPLHLLVFDVVRASARLTETYAGRDYQSATFTDATGLTYTVTAHADTGVRPFSRTGTVPVNVNGRRGVYGIVELDGVGDGDRGVAWQYGPREWATVYGDYGELSRGQALAVARAVRFDVHPLTTPIAIARPAARIRDWLVTRTGSDLYASVLMRDDGHDVQVSCRHERARATDDSTTIDGRSAFWSDNRTVLDINLGGGYSVSVLTVGGGTGQVRRIAAATTVSAAPGDMDTWFPATSALPGG